MAIRDSADAQRLNLLGAGQWIGCSKDAAKEFRDPAVMFNERFPRSVFQDTMRTNAAVGAASSAGASSSVLTPPDFKRALARFANDISAIGALRQRVVRVPCGVHVSEAALASGGGWIASGSGAALLKGEYVSATLQEFTYASIAVLTDALVRFGDPDASPAATALGRLDRSASVAAWQAFEHHCAAITVAIWSDCGVDVGVVASPCMSLVCASAHRTPRLSAAVCSDRR